MTQTGDSQTGDSQTGDSQTSDSQISDSRTADDAPDAGEKRLIGADDAMRCSTTERDRTAAAISAAAGEGRLLVEEADERLGRVFAARYRHELTALTSDLPSLDRTGGWPTIALMARDQLSADVRRLLGRGGDAATRRLRIVVAGVIAALLFVAVMAAMIHGIVDGPEFPGGRD